MPQKEVVLIAGHAIIHQVLIHFRIDPAAIVEVEGQKSFGVQDLGGFDSRWVFGVKIFGRFTLDKQGIGTYFQNGAHGQHIRFDNVLQSIYKVRVATELLIPPAIKGRKLGADVHFIDGRVQLNPGKPLGEGAGIVGKQGGEVGVLEIANPVGYAKMTQVDNGHNIALAQLAKGFIGKRPVVFSLAQKGGMKRGGP